MKARRKPVTLPQIGNIRAETVVREVANPLFSRDHAEGRTNPRQIAALINVRESGIGILSAKGALHPAQVAAADRFRLLFEAMGGTGARAIDYSREAVDGGRNPEPIGARALQAGRDLALAHEAITKAHGVYAWSLLCYICGEGKSVHELTETRRQRDTMTDRLRDALDVLAEHWRFSTRARPSHTHKSRA